MNKQRMDKELTSKLEVSTQTVARSLYSHPASYCVQEFHDTAATAANEVVFHIFPNKVRLPSFAFAHTSLLILDKIL